MATKVVDASALAAIAFAEPPAEQIRQRLQGMMLVAPGLIRYELASICLTKLRRHPQDESVILGRYSSLRSRRIDTRSVDFLQCIELGRRLGLSIYDASYLWLSRLLNAELVTLDQKLARAAAAA